MVLDRSLKLSFDAVETKLSPRCQNSKPTRDDMPYLHHLNLAARFLTSVRPNVAISRRDLELLELRECKFPFH